MTSAVLVMGGRSSDVASEVADGSHPKPEIVELAERHGVPIFDEDALVGSGILVRLLGRLLGPRWALAMRSVIDHRSRQVLVATGEDIGLPLALLHGVRRRRSRRCRIVVVGHGSYLNSSRAMIVGHLFRRREDLLFLCLSQAIATQFVERFGLARSQVQPTGWGVDTTFFTPDQRDRPATPFRVVSAGMANRDYATLLAAADGVADEVKIAMDSEWFRTRVDLGIDPSQIPDPVEARSYGDYVCLRDLYASAHVVVVPLHQARHASGYAVIAEAMAMGRPVITTRILGQSDFIVDGETGWYVDPGDVAGLRERLRAIAEHPADAEEVGRTAASAIRIDASVEAYARRIMDAAALLANRTDGTPRRRFRAGSRHG